MSAVESGLPGNLDEVLAAVRETPRGRWFLESYDQRVRSGDTAKVLESIAKLERHIQSMGTGADAVVLQRARQAISQARAEIASLEHKPAELTAEGQLFAKLAQLSKASFQGQPGLGQGVERALRLVSELDQQLIGQPMAAAPAPQHPNSYFKQDETIFEPAPAAKIVRMAPKPEPQSDSGPRGAKLVIQRVPSSTPAEPIADIAMEAPIVPAIESKPEEPTVAPQSRIVIVRRKVEELDAVPLLDQQAPEASSAA